MAVYTWLCLPFNGSFHSSGETQMMKDTPRWILTVVLNNFGPSLFPCLQPAAHCHQLKRSAVGNALASLDTSDRFYVHLSSPGLNEKVRENSHWDCSCESSTFLRCSYQLSVTPSLFWGRKHTHWCYQWLTKAPTTIRGSEIGNGYFQQLPGVSGDSGGPNNCYGSQERLWEENVEMKNCWLSSWNFKGQSWWLSWLSFSSTTVSLKHIQWCGMISFLKMPFQKVKNATSWHSGCPKFSLNLDRFQWTWSLKVQLKEILSKKDK